MTAQTLVATIDALVAVAPPELRLPWIWISAAASDAKASWFTTLPDAPGGAGEA